MQIHRAVCFALGVGVGWLLAYGFFSWGSPDRSARSPSVPDSIAEAPAGARINAPGSAQVERESTARREPPGVERSGLGSDGRTALDVEQEVEILLDDIEKLRSEGSSSQNEFGPLLRRLGEMDTEESIGALIALMEDHDLDFSHRVSVFADALRASDDPRIYPAARALLEEQLALGETGWNEVNGFYELVASKGGADAAAFLLERLRTEELGGTVAAWDGVKHLADQERWREFLDLALQSPIPSGIEAFAAWDNEALVGELARLLQEGTVSATEIDRALQVVARCARPEHLRVLETSYWNPLDTETRRVTLSSMVGLASSEHLTKGQVLSAVQPILVHALRSSDPALQLTAARVVDSNPHLGATAEILDLLSYIAGLGPAASSRTKEFKAAHAAVSRLQASSR